jgi:formate--tetrahydrofolate ligase
VCIAKTHLSISSDPTLRGAPTGWILPITQTMPGLGRHPAAQHIGLDPNGDVVGLSQSSDPGQMARPDRVARH